MTSTCASHCDNCFVVSCVATHCAMQPCPLGCRADLRLHACKIADHTTHICPSAVVPCINASYGCTRLLHRGKLAAHLCVCPASVVHCAYEYTRQLLVKQNMMMKCDETQQLKLIDEELDVILARRDENIVRSALHVPKAVRARLLACEQWNKRLPTLPLPARAECVEYVEYSADSNSDDEDDLEPVLSPVAQDCVICQHDPASQHLHVVGAGWKVDRRARQEKRTAERKEKARRRSAFNAAVFEASRGLGLRVRLDAATPAPRPRSVVTFQCSQTLRRDEFCDHYRLLHCDIMPNLGDFYKQRCPLHTSGCSFVTERLTCQQSRREIRYNVALDAVTMTRHTADLLQYEDYMSLDSLPRTILLSIFSMLDSASISCLSQTNSSLRETCMCLLQTHGMIEFEWYRTMSGLWRPRVVFRFSKMTEPIERWNMKLSCGAMAEHLKVCAFYEAMEHDPALGKMLTCCG